MAICKEFTLQQAWQVQNLTAEMGVARGKL